VTLYAESSAVLAWLLDQPQGHAVAATLAAADLVLASDLTVVECDRVIVRAVAVGELHEADAVDRQARLNAVSARWALLGLDDEILERARRPFPLEPIRTLDAIHLASALTARKALPDLAMLSLDVRLREVAASLGLTLLPAL
jgi:predicted nucleic acid-binding protein